MSKCCSSGGRGRIVKRGTSLTIYGAFAEELALGWALDSSIVHQVAMRRRERVRTDHRTCRVDSLG